MLGRKNYSKKKYFKHEIENFFYKNWIFAGLISDLKNNRDFVTFEVGKKSVVVQNFMGELIAFQNICLHRFKKIQTDEKGNRAFICEYHGWNYDKNGVPRIPKQETFDQKDIKCLHLKKYKLETCGAFVFVNLSKEDNYTLKNFLGHYYEELEGISKHLDTKMSVHNSIEHKANWKLLVENVLEGYHCPLVHKNSLVNLGYCIGTPRDIKYYNAHSSFNYPRVKKVEKIKSNKFDFINEVTFSHNSFYHIHIFPNLFISSTSGSFFYIGNVIPLSKRKSNLKLSFISSNFKRQLTKNEDNLNKALFSLNTDSAVAIIMEDKSMVENCQLGIETKSDVVGALSLNDESRLLNFHKNILCKEYLV